MSGIGGENFKARYQRTGKSGWKGVTTLAWCGDFDEAQCDLNELAKKKGWREYDSD